MLREDMKWWAGLLGAICLALIGAGVVPHPYDKWVVGIAAVCGAICTYQMTPSGSSKNGAWLIVVLLGGLTLTGCASMPPNLTPAASTAWHQTQVQKPLDLLRDMAIDANAQIPPLVSASATTAIVTWHRAAIVTIHAVPTGWQSTVRTGLTQALAGLTPAERVALQPYVQLVDTVLNEVTQ